MSENIAMSLVQRMKAISAEIKTVKKSLSVSTGGSKGYSAVAERDILKAVKPLEEKYGVFSFPASREIIESHMLDSESTYTDKAGNQTVTTRTTFFVRIKTVYRFLNTDDPSDFIEMTTFSDGIDSQDKRLGKAMTYGDKYALMKAYKIPTGDEEDEEIIKEKKYVKKTENYFCVDCEKELKDANMNGKKFSAAQLAAYTQQKYGKVLCPECASRPKWVMEHEGNEGIATV